MIGHCRKDQKAHLQLAFQNTLDVEDDDMCDRQHSQRQNSSWYDKNNGDNKGRSSRIETRRDLLSDVGSLSSSMYRRRSRIPTLKEDILRD